LENSDLENAIKDQEAIIEEINENVRSCCSYFSVLDYYTREKAREFLKGLKWVDCLKFNPLG